MTQRPQKRQSSARGADYVVREWENMWFERVGCQGKARWGSQTDGKHTRVGLISPSGWSGRSSQSGSTRCPSWHGLDVMVWEERCWRREEALEGLFSMGMNLRKPDCYSRELPWWPHWPEKGMSGKRNLVLTGDRLSNEPLSGAVPIQYWYRSDISRKFFWKYPR